MQSSAGMVFRAIVMLACLVAVPLAALFGSALPDLARQVLTERLGLVRLEAWQTPRVGPSTNPPAQPTHSPAVVHGSLANPWENNGLPFSPTWPGGNFTGQTAEMGSAANLGQPANFSPTGGKTAAPLPVRSAGASGPVQASHHMPGSEQAGFLTWPEQQTAVSNPIRSPAAGRFDDPGLHTPPAGLAPPVDRFSQIHQRLRDLGSVYSLLETWGDQGHLYRFYCRMAIGGNPNYTRYFEATDPEPLSAMSRVVGEVEAWRRSGQP